MLMSDERHSPLRFGEAQKRLNLSRYLTRRAIDLGCSVQKVGRIEARPPSTACCAVLSPTTTTTRPPPPEAIREKFEDQVFAVKRPRCSGNEG